MQQWDCDIDWWFQWWTCETIFTFSYVRFYDKIIYIWHWIYLFMMWIMMFFVWIIIFYVENDFFYVNYDNLWCSLHIFGVYFYLNYSGNDIPRRKPTVWSRKKVKRLKVRLIGGVSFEKNISNKDSLFVPSNEYK